MKVDPMLEPRGRASTTPGRPGIEERFARPTVSLPTGGGAIRGIGEKLQANPVTGIGATSFALGASPGRGGFEPELALTYDSGSGNGAFGLGWGLSLPAITRKTEKGLPRYRDSEESDVFLLAGVEDLVAMVDVAGDRVADTTGVPGYLIERYRPRIESEFARIERWTRQADGDVHWRTVTPDNVLSLYGKDEESRIFDSADPDRVFSWLLCETRDDRGNAILYRYVAEDASGIDVTQPHERGRGDANSPSRTANRYLKRVLYGNREPLLDGVGRRPVELTPEQVQDADWLFEAVIDYGEHDADDPAPDDAGDWLCRADPFSSYRSGFEVRTYRLCRRVLMFHHFPDEPDVGQGCLVASTDLTHAETPAATFLVAATRRGYLRDAGGGYTAQALPPVEFTYSEASIDTEIRELDAQSLENLPAGLALRYHEWADLNGEGLAGVLAESAGEWWYKPSLGGGTLGPLERVASVPAIAALRETRQQLVDVDGDGRLELVQLDREPAGFVARNFDDGWDDFVPFSARPRVDWGSPNLQPVDLTGDGLADLLTSGEEAFIWYPSLLGEGFGPAERVAQALDEERGPRLLLADGTQTVFLADMSGDGLADLVRINHSDVSYWPNLGYGSFGRKVTMSGGPLLDSPDRFDPRRVRLADVDGSGPTDLLYVGAHEVRVFFNQAGNSWSPPERLPALPHLDDQASVQVADLLGNGTACLVWSSPLARDEGRAVRYVDLMGGQKPNLLVGALNNLGAETRVRYAPSTAFYLADRRAGKPWLTRLPFPVSVVEEIEHRDRVTGTRFVSRFSYHHGYFDGVEREFRGFAMTEQHDCEAFEDYVVGVAATNGTQDTTPELFQPPVTTRTWSHTGAYLGGRSLVHELTREYYGQSRELPAPILPPDLDEDELRECVRALKGLPLRQEVFSFDGSPEAEHPYRVTEHTYDVERVQRRGEQRHGVFAVHGREMLTHDFDRDPDDPRVAHELNLELGPHGESVLAASVVYGRKVADPALPAAVTASQSRTFVAFVENDYTPDIDRQQPIPAYRLRTGHETRRAELTGVTPAGSLFTVDELRGAVAAAAPIAYEAQAGGLTVQRRALSRSRRRFRDDGLAPLPQGQWDTLGLPYEDYQLALTPGTVAAHYAGVVAVADLAAAGYLDLDGDGSWWAPSGRHVYPADPAAHFYLPTGVRDALGTETLATLDAYDLLPERTRVIQAPWSEVSVTNDYRVLGPIEMTDQNGNRTVAELDALGMVVASASMGKAGAGEGDTLADPTVRIEYDLDAWMVAGRPVSVRVLARERHGAGNTRWQDRYVYSSGCGEVAMVKRRAPPGPALQPAPDGGVSEAQADPRWIGDGRRVLNNKGGVVKAYPPFFSTTHEYEDEEALRSLGTTPVLRYDAIGRNFRADLPDGTLTRVVFGPWSKLVHDANDTVLESGWYADRGSPDPATEPEPLANPERRAAWLTAKHAETPGAIHLDSLGRAVYTVSDLGGGTTAAVRTEVDLTASRSRLLDEQGREAARGFAAIGGAPIHSVSAERGQRWVFHDVLGGLVRTWDHRGRAFRVSYDELHRPVALFVLEPGEAEELFTYILHGDRHPDAAARNLHGVPHQIFDGAGMASIDRLDFAGNPTAATRVFARDYASALDWGDLDGQPDFAGVQAAAAPLLEVESFSGTSTYDALQRPVEATLHGGTVLRPSYDEAGSVASLEVQVEGQGPFVDVLAEQVRDARGRRQMVRYGNGLETRYTYDPDSLHLTNLLTLRTGAPRSESVQDVHYTYDATGNVAQIRDAAQQTHFFANAVVPAQSLYEYDALYQLVRATGREHAVPANDAIRNGSDLPPVPQLPHPNDATAVRTYTEHYEYDLLGNIRRHRHVAPVAGGGWTREYGYQADTIPGDTTNRLTATSRPGDPPGGPYTATYDYDDYGNMTRLHSPTPGELTWDALDQLRRVDLGGGGTAFYTYGATGNRTRKVIERQGALRTERIYLGPLEIYRERRGAGDPHLERRTIHVADDAGRIAQIDVKTRDDDGSDPANPLGVPLLRYVYGDHLESVTLETDAGGTVISYEEYHPFGTTAYRSSRPGHDVSLKRYRFAGQERDEETGLFCMGVRYYAPWLGRWTSPDPAGFVSGLNLYRYCRNSPVVLIDPRGTDEETAPRKTSYSLADLGITKTSDPAEVARRMRGAGFDFTGFNEAGEQMPADPQGRGVGLPRPIPSGWDVGTWLREPGGEGEGTGVGAGEGVKAAPETEIVVRAGPGTGTGKEVSETPGTGEKATPGVGGGAATHTGPAAERFIWDYDFPGTGVAGSQRGRILEWMLGVPWRDNTAGIDKITATSVQQIKSTDAYADVGNLTRSSTRDAANYIADNPTTTTGRQPQAVIITPTDAPAQAADDIADALTPGRGRRIPPNALPPDHIRGLPGGWGMVSRGFTFGGTGLSAYALIDDIRRGDVPMGVADAIGTVGGGLEIYALAVPGATVAGVSAMSAGLVLGGVGIAVGSAVSGYRAWKRGDVPGVIAGALGFLAGIAIIAGIVFGAPLLLAAGIIGAIGVGLFHLGRWLFS